ncbi:MAG: efflux RND transporter periplasmic adaptor subunit [Candidatus Hydrogenedentes bacterium]|nr:efflux RND transporter periplasmic adaptor subunit [Candidatus Hydrogenedentota bacterium]
MTNGSDADRQAAQPRRVNWIGVLAQAAAIPLLLAGGWFMRGLLPSGPAGGPPGPMGGQAGPPAVVVAAVTEGPAEAPQEFMGHIEAVETVNVMPQVAGYLETVHFEEGGTVAAGDLLFTIERAPFEARIALAQAAVQQAEANLPAARADLDAAQADCVRAGKYYERLGKADERGVAQADMDKATADFEQAQARVKQGAAAVEQAQAAFEQAKANLQLARIDLDYTEIRAPINGRIGKALVTEGNYVTPASGALARIVQADPVRVVYSVPDREYMRLLGLAAKEGEGGIDTRLRLPDGTVYDGRGAWDFADNELDPATGTIALRAQFANPAGMLVPMMHVTVLAQSAEARTAPQVPSQAVMVGQRGEFVYVVNAEGVVEQRGVVLGAELEGRRIVQEGLAPGEQVVVEGLQKAQPGQPVQVTAAPAGAKGM